MSNASVTDVELPGLDCGLCGYRSCTELAAQLSEKPDLLKRCIPLAADFMSVQPAPQEAPPQLAAASDEPPDLFDGAMDDGVRNGAGAARRHHGVRDR